MRVLNVADGLSASAAPGTVSPSEFPVYVDDAAYAAANGAPTDGKAYIDSTLNVLKVYVAGSWRALITADATVQLTNKDYAGGAASNARRLTLPSAAKATLSGLTRKEATLVYATDEDRVYVDNGTTLVGVGGGGGGSAVVLRVPEANAPLEGSSLGLELLDFDYQEEQECFALLQVPADYVAGVQIKLVGGSFGINSASGKVFFKAITYLLEEGLTVIGTYANTHTSQNAEVTVPATPSTLKAIGDIDLTDASGQVNSRAVAAGDWLLVKVFRDVSAESSPSQASARLLRFSFAPKFTA